MSEKDLTTVLIYLSRARENLNAATELSESLLHDHNVASEINLVRRYIGDLVKELDGDYRATHFKTERR